MGYNQNHAGIHLLPKENKDRMNFLGEKDKYGMMLGEYKANNALKDSEILQDVKICNFVVLTNTKGEISNCLCGGKFKYIEKLPIHYHNRGKMVTIQLSGKQCIDCGRKLFVKSEIVKKIRNVMRI
mgnify:CR=1 FL=1